MRNHQSVSAAFETLLLKLLTIADDPYRKASEVSFS